MKKRIEFLVKQLKEQTLDKSVDKSYFKDEDDGKGYSSEGGQ